MGIAGRSTAGLLLSVMLAALFAALVLLAVEAYNAKPAEAGESCCTAARNGKIHYASGPDFDFHDARNWAVGQWNRLEPIDTTRDTGSTDMDLRFEQYPGRRGEPYAAYDGYYNPNPPDVDTINFNTSRWKPPGLSLNPNQRKRVAVHELGHALKMTHAPRKTEYWRTHSIMYFDSRKCPFLSFQRWDRNEYNRIW